MPALYVVSGLISYPEYLPERAHITVRYRSRPLPLAFSRLRLVHHVRRYVGQVGSYPATVELAWQRPDSVSGSGRLGGHAFFSWGLTVTAPTPAVR